MTGKWKIHLVQLPRPFAIPAIVLAVLLGGIISGAAALPLGLACLAAALLTASGHTFNTYLDHEWTKLDKGEAAERSRSKVYTAGQQPIASGIMSPREVLTNALVTLGLSAIPAYFVGAMVGPWIWIVWGIGASITFWYSWSKLHWHPELVIGFFFATLPVWAGMAASGTVDLWRGFVIGLPLFLFWGLAAEPVDQWMDWEPNWPKGGRSLGMLIGRLNVPIRWIISFAVIMAFVVQAALVGLAWLAPLSLLSLIAIVPLMVGCIWIDYDKKKGLIWALSGAYVFTALLVVGQWIGG